MNIAQHALHRIGRAVAALILMPLALVLAMARVKFLTGGRLLTRFGHAALEPALYVKSGLLGWRPRSVGILLVRPHAAVNWTLLQYWRPHVKILTHPVLVALLRPFERHPLLAHNTYHVGIPKYGRVPIVPAVYPIQRQYEATHGDKPVLRLSPSDEARGRRCLEALGLPREAWFVCLHVRESGYLGDRDRKTRNSDIMTYLPAVEAVVQRGGWVIRMGDPTMTPLPPLDRVIDYVHSDLRSDWMDVCCLAMCRFFLGSNSGPLNVAFAFGVPCALPNFAPMGHGAYSARDLFIPKLYWDPTAGRYLTIPDVLRSPLRHAYYQHDFASASLTLIDNSPEDIRDLAIEMLDRLDGTVEYTSEDQRLQERFQALLALEPLYRTTSRVGRDFLRKHARLLSDQSEPAAPRYAQASVGTPDVTV